MKAFHFFFVRRNIVLLTLICAFYLASTNAPQTSADLLKSNSVEVNQPLATVLQQPNSLAIRNEFGLIAAQPALLFSSLFDRYASSEKAGGRMFAQPIMPAPRGTTAFDYDGDGRADASRWFANLGEWRVQPSLGGAVTNTIFGGVAGTLAPADYDGDGKTDFATFNLATGAWAIKQSSNGATVNYTLGQAGDKPVPADYDGDGKADVAVWRPSNGT